MFSHEQVNGFQDLLAPLEFFILSIAVAVSIFLAVVVYVKKPKSATNKIFFLLGITAALWLISSYVIKLPLFEDMRLMFTRLAIFFAAPMSASFFLLAH